MSFAQLQGNPEVVRALVGMVDSGKIPHAIIFQEDDGGGAFPLCIAFLQYLYCSQRGGGDSCGVCPSCNKIGKLIHPDVHFIFPAEAQKISVNYLGEFRALALANPCFTEAELTAALGLEKKNSIIAVKEAQFILDTLSLSALEGGYRSVVIYLPEKLNAEAANRLLKMIEEPAQKTQFLLITHQAEKVLPTIASRCQRIRVRPSGGDGAEAGFESPELFGELMDALLSKDLQTCLDIADRVSAMPSRESAKAFCKFASGQLRLIFLAQQGLTELGTVTADALRWAAACPKAFPRRALAVFDRGYSLIERNVNAKILFTDIVDRLYILI